MLHPRESVRLPDTGNEEEHLLRVEDGRDTDGERHGRHHF